MKFLSNIDMTKNQLMNAVFHLLGSAPSTPVEGQFYHNSATHIPQVHNGTAFQNILLENRIGASNGVAGLDAGGKVPTTQIPDSILGQLEYQGVYDASGGAAPSSPQKGWFWIISVAGTINTVAYSVGDWIVYNGTSFDKVDNTDAVTSVAGRIGAVTLNADDVAEVTNKRYVTDAQRTILTNTSGTNSGNETATTIGTLINGATAKTTPVDADMLALMDSAASNVVKKLSWANIKAALKTYFDTLYNNYSHPTGDGNLHVPATSTTNNGKVLTAGSTAGSISWQSLPAQGVQKYVITIGNGSLTSLPVTHNLNSRNVAVTVYETASPYAEVLCDVEHTDANTVTIKTTIAPTASQYTVVVMG